MSRSSADMEPLPIVRHDTVYGTYTQGRQLLENQTGAAPDVIPSYLCL